MAAKPGTRDTTEKDLQKTAYRWLRRKRCDLLVSGRVKTGNIVSLRFIPSEKSVAQPQTYVLQSDTLELPTTFIADLGVAIAANVTASVKDAVESRKYIVPTLQTPSVRLDTATRQTQSGFGGAVLGTLIYCNALVKVNLFEQTGNRSDLEASILLNREALSIRTKDELPDDWSTSQNNLGTSLGRMAAFNGDVKCFHEAIDALNAALEERSPHKSLSRWTGTQVNCWRPDRTWSL